VKSLASVEAMAEIRGRLRDVRADDHARWGRMSPKQMVRHLKCSYEVALGERMVGPVKGLPPVVIKWLALRSGLRWLKNMSTAPELRRAIKEPADEGFDEVVASTIAKMEELAKRTECAPVHCMFGPMTTSDWMRWGYLHADHHLRQFGR
jgi:hypothetical protein